MSAQSEWNARNASVVQASKRAWIKRNPAKHSEYNRRAHGNARAMWRRARLRAKQRGLPFTIAPEDVKVPERCPVLGIALISKGTSGACDHTPTLDQIRPGRGYTPNNVAVISWRANRLKSDATLAELRAIVRYYARRTK